MVCRGRKTSLKKELTPYSDVYAEVGLAESVLGLAGVPPGVVLRGVGDPQLGCDPVQLADFGRAGLARKGQVVATVLAPLDAIKRKGTLVIVG